MLQVLNLAHAREGRMDEHHKTMAERSKSRLVQLQAPSCALYDLYVYCNPII